MEGDSTSSEGPELVSSGVGAPEGVSVIWGELDRIGCLCPCRDGEGLGYGYMVVPGFYPLPPSQPGCPVIPLTNWHLINPNELFSNFIIQHQELMRERVIPG